MSKQTESHGNKRANGDFILFYAQASKTILTVLSELRMSLTFPYLLGKSTKEDRIL